MPGRTIAVDRDTLKWARETSGLSPIQAAELLRVDVELLKELEEGNHLPNVTLFNHMVVVYRRSPAVLMLSPPPLPDRLPIDRRTIEGKQQPYSREIIFAVREAREFQEELADLVGAGPVLFQEGPVLERMLQSGALTGARKAVLEKLYLSLNPLRLSRQIEAETEELLRLAWRRGEPPIMVTLPVTAVLRSHPWLGNH